MSTNQSGHNHEPIGMDIPLSAIIPLRKRKIGNKPYAKLKANIATIGLIDPLCVCMEGDKYYLLDGYFRWRILAEVGLTEAPCLVLDRKDIYTPNRQVNNLSRVEQRKMMLKALEKIDERTIAESFGLQSLDLHSYDFIKTLHPTVHKAVESGQVSKSSAKEFIYVTQERQAEIIKLMRSAKDYSPTFLKTLIHNTPVPQRVKTKKQKTPWERASPKYNNLSKKLAEANLNYAFYRTHYHKYSADLMKLAMYIRQIMHTSPLHAWIRKNDPETFAFFKELLRDSAIRTNVSE